MNAKRMAVVAAVFVLSGSVASAVLAEEGHGRSMHDMHGMYGGSGHDMGGQMGRHSDSTGHYLRHLLKHAKEIGLSADQVARIKAIRLDLGRTRIKAEAAVQVAELELAALTEDETSDLAAVEAKVKQSEMLEADLRMAAIKARREAAALLTPEQREKEKAEREKMMMRPMGPGHEGMMPGGMMPGGMMGGGMMGGERGH